MTNKDQTRPSSKPIVQAAQSYEHIAIGAREVDALIAGARALHDEDQRPGDPDHERVSTLLMAAADRSQELIIALDRWNAELCTAGMIVAPGPEVA